MNTKAAGIDKATVVKMLVGGGLLGAGAGAGTMMVRHLKSLQEKARKVNDTSADDDVLYINLPPKQAADSNSASTFAAGGLAALAGTVLSYNAVRNIYNRAKTRQLQKELDRAQNVYLGGLSSVKQAGDQFSILSKGVGGAYTVSALAALGSAVVAHRILDKQFPALHKPSQGQPRKIVVRTQQANQEPPREEVITDAPVTANAVEGLVRSHLGNKQAAAVSGIDDLVSAVAQRGGDSVRDAIKDFGLESTFDLVKGARHEPMSKLAKELAISWVSRDAYTANAIAPLLAVECFAAGAPKIAAYVDRSLDSDLFGIVEQTVVISREKIYDELLKSAGDDDMLPGPLKNMFLAHTLTNILQETSNGSDKTVAESGSNTPSSEDSPDLSKSPVIEAEDDAALKFMQQHGRKINQGMARAA